MNLKINPNKQKQDYFLHFINKINESLKTLKLDVNLDIKILNVSKCKQMFMTVKRMFLKKIMKFS